MRPVIGITCSVENEETLCINKRYITVVERAGGLPLIFPVIAEAKKIDNTCSELLARVDGVILSGGGDVDPVFFGEEPLPLMGRIDPDRDIFEIRLSRLALALKIPMLAVCRGIQVLNIAAGGTLLQDLRIGTKSPVKHFQQAPKWYPTHRIDIVEGSLLARVLGPKPLRVNSFHRQAVGKVAPDFIVSARSADGVIEGIENILSPFILGVQFHPEHLWLNMPGFFNLFRSLVEEALRFHKSRRNF